MLRELSGKALGKFFDCTNRHDFNTVRNEEFFYETATSFVYLCRGIDNRRDFCGGITSVYPLGGERQHLRLRDIVPGGKYLYETSDSVLVAIVERKRIS